MDGRRRALRTWRIAASALLIFAATFVAAAGWSAIERAPTTEAGLFGGPVVDLVLEPAGPGSVAGFLGAPNFAPGDHASGVLILRGRNVTDASAYDLDLDVRIDERLPVGGGRLDEHLIVRTLRLGSDDLLTSADGGRDLVREIDGNAILANGDGRLSLSELQAGANDLPCPDADGTRFDIGVQFASEADDGQQGAAVRLSFVFRLGDKADADLN